MGQDGRYDYILLAIWQNEFLIHHLILNTQNGHFPPHFVQQIALLFRLPVIYNFELAGEAVIFVFWIVVALVYGAVEL